MGTNHLNLKRNSNILIYETFKNSICKIIPILSQPQSVNGKYMKLKCVSNGVTSPFALKWCADVFIYTPSLIEKVHVQAIEKFSERVILLEPGTTGCPVQHYTGCRVIYGCQKGLSKGPYLPCVSMAVRALLAQYHRYLLIAWQHQKPGHQQPRYWPRSGIQKVQNWWLLCVLQQQLLHRRIILGMGSANGRRCYQLDVAISHWLSPYPELSLYKWSGTGQFYPILQGIGNPIEEITILSPQ